MTIIEAAEKCEREGGQVRLPGWAWAEFDGHGFGGPMVFAESRQPVQFDPSELTAECWEWRSREEALRDG